MRKYKRTRGNATYFRAYNPGQRIAVLIILAIVAGITIGLILPNVSPQVAQITGQYAASGPAADILDTLTVDDNPSNAGYDRDSFGYRQTDDDNNGCDVRDDVLARDLTNVVYTRGCKVKSGVLNDPYTGKVIHFKRGADTSAQVQIDHVVALENAWASGARNWDNTKRVQFGNDMENLLAVDGPANQEKGSASAAYWLPTNSEYRCTYISKQIHIKAKYELSVTSQEKRAMKAVLRNCPAEEQ